MDRHTGAGMSEPCPDALVAFVCRLADASGAAIRPHFRRPIPVELKADHSPVTAADRDAERAIRDLLAGERPNDGIIGEEFGSERADADYVWVVDPIDGTRAFITGRPLFGTLIACLRHGRPILGVIDQPVTGDRWLGAMGRPTLFNGAPARVRTCDTLAKATLSATSPHMFEADDFAAFERVRRAGVRDTTYGGDCYAYGLLAAGFIDLVIESGLKLFDFAALIPVIEGSGGVITDWEGRALGPGSSGRVVAAGDARVHAQALGQLA